MFLFWGRAWWDPYADAVTQEERLWIADPKAIHHILQGSSYMYGKTNGRKETIAILLGKGLAWAEGESFLTHLVSITLIPELGDVHKRQRRAMAPAFGLVEAKGLFPYFARCSNSVSHWSSYT